MSYIHKVLRQGTIHFNALNCDCQFILYATLYIIIFSDSSEKFPGFHVYSYEMSRLKLLIAIRECTHAFITFYLKFTQISIQNELAITIVS